jgi:hypothetical protein
MPASTSAAAATPGADCAPTLPHALQDAGVARLLRDVAARRGGGGIGGGDGGGGGGAASPPRALFLLDYDGTLSHIHPDPERAVLTPGMREVLRRLALGAPASGHAVAVLTGRCVSGAARADGGGRSRSAPAARQS